MGWNRWKKSLFRLLIFFLVVTVLLAGVYFPAGWILRRAAVRQIAELTNTRVEAESIELGLDGSVSMEGLAIRSKKGWESEGAILKAEKVYAKFDLLSVLLFGPRLEELRVRDFVLSARHNLETDSWNLEGVSLQAPQGTDGRMPLIELSGGRLEYVKLSEEGSKVAASLPVEANLELDDKTRQGYKFEIKTAARQGWGRSKLTGYWRPGVITVAGSVASADVAGFEMAWLVDVLAAELSYEDDGSFCLKLRARDLMNKGKVKEGDGEGIGGLFGGQLRILYSLSKFFNEYRPRGRVDADMEVRGNFDRFAEVDVNGKIHCRDLRICYRKFPYVIEHLTGEVSFTEEGAVLKGLKGRHGEVELLIDGWCKGLGESWKFDFEVKSDNMVLDEDLYEALNEHQQRFWREFSPSGEVGIHYHSHRESSSEFHRRLVTRLHGVDSVYRHFAYPLKGLEGRLVFKLDSIDACNLVSEYGGRRIVLNGEISNYEAEKPSFDIVVNTQDVPLDELLGELLPGAHGRIYRRYCEGGLVDANLNVRSEGTEQVSFDGDVSVSRGILRIGQGRVVEGVSGELFVSNEVVEVKELCGKYSGGGFCVEGTVRPVGEGAAPAFKLWAEGKEIELGEQLFSLLPGSLAEIARNSEFSGGINCRAELEREEAKGSVKYDIMVDCIDNSAQFEAFPYPLSDINGRVHIRGEEEPTEIRLEDVRATAGGVVGISEQKAKVGISGVMSRAGGEFREGEFSVQAQNFLLDERLGSVLGGEIGELYEQVSPRGFLDAQFENVHVRSKGAGEKQAEFDCELVFRDCDFEAGVGLTDINGVVSTSGSYEQGGKLEIKEVRISADKIRVAGKALSNLEAELRRVEGREVWRSEHLVSGFYEGRLMGDLTFGLSSEGGLNYEFSAGFEDVNLLEFLRDRHANSGRRSGRDLEGQVGDGAITTGNMQGSLAVRGEGGSRVGRCRLRIRDMKAGRLSALAKLLYVLRLKRPEEFAFEQMVVDAFLRDEEAMIEEIDMWGRALAFEGLGFFELEDENVSIVLTARGRRVAEAEPSVLQSLPESLGRGVVRIKVSGDIYNPKVEVKTLPVLSAPFRLFGGR